MESGGKGEDGGFDVFREDGFAELLGEGDFGGVGEILDLGDEGMEQKVRVVEGTEAGAADGFFLSCPSAFPLPSTSSPTSSSYRSILCFGGDEGFPFPGDGSNRLPHKSSASGNDSYSSTSSSSSSSSLSKLKKKTEETEDCSAAADRGRASTTTTTTITKGTGTTKTAATASKKPRKEQPQQRPTSQSRTLKVRKENLGERITALQQLVSPFGKSDTASVLHEALGYIKFLHSQVQVLSSPYLQRLPSSAHLREAEGGAEGERRHDLRSRGLCLVPVASTAHMAGSNGADFWSPAMGSCSFDFHQISEH